MRWPALFIAAILLAPATASAQRVEDTFFNSVIPTRVDHLIGFTPTTCAIHPLPERVNGEGGRCEADQVVDSARDDRVEEGVLDALCGGGGGREQEDGDE